MRAKLCAMLACILSIGAAGPANALTFIFTQQSGYSLTSEQRAAFIMASAAWSARFTDNITVNLSIGFSNLGAGTLGQTTINTAYYSASSVQAHLAADATSVDDAKAIAAFPVHDSSAFMGLTTAQARAIGFSPTPSGSDAFIELNSLYNYSTSRNAAGGIAAGTYDLVGLAEHEIGHALGFLSVIDGVTFTQTLLDQYRYSSPGDQETDAGNAYFSLDGGVTTLASFADGKTDQASHWQQGTAVDGAVALMNPGLVIGQVQNITDLDSRAFDVIGYNRRVVAVPEPATWAMMISGFGMIGGALRRRRRELVVSFG